MTLAYFCLSALDLIDGLPDSEEQQGWKAWIYAQQLISPTQKWAGFRGGPCFGDLSVEVFNLHFVS